MAVTKNQLKAWFQTALKPTQAQFAAWIDAMRHVDDKIAQTDLTTVLSDKIDSLPNIDAINTAINGEATARAAVDTTLQTNITAEATARASADTTLQTNITAEAAARASADATKITFKSVTTYTLMIADGTPTVATMYEVIEDENKSYARSTYLWKPSGRREWVATTPDN